jgi:hypothetical protein
MVVILERARNRLCGCRVPAAEMAGVEEVWAVDLGPIPNFDNPYRSVFTLFIIIMAVMLPVPCEVIDLVSPAGIL